GLGLPDCRQAWPWLLAQGLAAERHEPVDVTLLEFWPVGPRAVAAITPKAAASEADTVIVVIGSFYCAVRTIAERVRRRWGNRVASVFRKWENAFELQTGGGSRFVGTP